MAVALLTAAALHGCTGATADDRVLVVLGPWPDNSIEATVFVRVLKAYEKKATLDITYQGTRAIGQVLSGKIKDGTLPDVAIMPQVGEMASYATEDLARPVTSLVGWPHRRFGKPGAVAADDRALWRGSEAYAVAIKTDVKSLIIYENQQFTPAKPTTLADLPGLTGSKPWCLGLGAPSSPGWPGTDWIEDLVLHEAGPDGYERWASGRDPIGRRLPLPWADDDEAAPPGPVRRAFDLFGTIAGNPGQREDALLRSPEEADQILDTGKCTAMHQSSFYAGGSGEIHQFPEALSGGAVEVSADFAARFTDHPAAEGLLRFLMKDPEWVAASGGFVLQPDPLPWIYQGSRANIAQILADNPPRCLDASDAMPTTMAAAFQNAILEYVAEPARVRDILADLQEVQDALPPDERLRVYCTV
ncbi:hypothetical protein AB0M20_20005 [Actinoplanes sp. NPDC051633]|uniref:hypothetical protein n=1 Tax=Actinoplanes sp. NPDC051633 TaxID=3155670 RepID=UPI0034341D68